MLLSDISLYTPRLKPRSVAMLKKLSDVRRYKHKQTF